MKSGEDAAQIQHRRTLFFFERAVASLIFNLQVFGIDPKTGKPTDAAGSSLSVEPARQSSLSQRINAVLASLRKGRANYQKCFSVRQGVCLPCSVLHVMTLILLLQGSINMFALPT